LDVRKSIWPVQNERWGVGVVVCLEQGADYLHMVQHMPLHPRALLSLASFKSRLVLPFWYWLTQVVLEKRLLNGCSSSTFCKESEKVRELLIVRGVMRDFWNVLLLQHERVISV